MIAPAVLTGSAASTDNCGPGLTMSCAGALEPTPVGGSTIDAVANCTAVAPAGVATAATAVYCWLVSPANNETWGAALGQNAPHWVPGTVSTVAVAFTSLPVQAYELCVEGGYAPLVGAAQDPVNPVCAPLVIT